jgi:ParB/RepB/Spo0J family partition protein
MATKIDAVGVDRRDIFHVPPSEIMMDVVANGRAYPHDDEGIMKLVKSFKEDGQIQPVLVRKVEGHKLQLVLGYRRYAASIKYNETYPEEPMKLKCLVTTMSPEEAFRRNIVENRERKETTPVDDAMNMGRLREDHGWTDTKIAEFYEVTPAYVCQLKKLLGLREHIRKLVHTKKLSLQSAFQMADLNEKEQDEILTEASAEGDTSTKSVTKKVRGKKQKKGQGTARTLSEVREFFEGLLGPAEPVPVRALAELMALFIAGKNSDKEMQESVELLFALYKKDEKQVA